MQSWTTNFHAFRSFLLVAQLDPAGISSRIREAREAAGLTQQQLADLIERHKRTIENYENNRAPDYAKLNKIARVLNRPVEWFLHGDAYAAAVAAGDGGLDELERAVQGLQRDVRAILAAVAPESAQERPSEHRRPA